MSKAEAKKIAEEFVLKHKDSFSGVSSKEIRSAVDRVAKALVGLKGQQAGKISD